MKEKKERKWLKTILYLVLMVVWVGSAIIVSQLIVGYLMIFLIGRENFSQPAPTAIYSALSYVVAFLLIVTVPPLIVNKTRKKRKKDELVDRRTIGLMNLPTWTDIGLSVVGFVVYMIIAFGLVTLFSLFPWFDAEQTQELGFSTYLVGLDRVIAFITLVIVAPIAEELIFRGWLYGKMREYLSEKLSNNISIVISSFLVSLLFAIVHFQWNVGVNVFAMSIVLCGLREITGTIYSGIILHMIKNGLAFYLLYVLGT